MIASSVVRPATLQDKTEIWRLFLQGYKENGILEISPEKVDWFLTRALQPELIPLGDTGPRGVIGVIGQVGALEGIAFLMIGEFWYSRVKHIEELLVLVDTECRKSNHAQALINWMKNQVEITKLPLLSGIISNERTEAKCRLYRRMLPKLGEFFWLTPKGSSVSPALVLASS